MVTREACSKNSTGHDGTQYKKAALIFELMLTLSHFRMTLYIYIILKKWKQKYLLYNEFAFFKRTNTFDGVKGINARSAHLFPDTVLLSGDEELACLCLSLNVMAERRKRSGRKSSFLRLAKKNVCVLFAGRLLHYQSGTMSRDT